jgi:hypothetical protein
MAALVGLDDNWKSRPAKDGPDVDDDDVSDAYEVDEPLEDLDDRDDGWPTRGGSVRAITLQGVAEEDPSSDGRDGTRRSRFQSKGPRRQSPAAVPHGC